MSLDHHPSNNLLTDTEYEQLQVENLVLPLLGRNLPLDRDNHISYLLRHLQKPLPSAWTCLDSQRPWILYWLLQSLALLEYEIDNETKLRCVETLKLFRMNDWKGFAGGTRDTQPAHLLTTYAAVHTICLLEHPAAYELLSKKAIYGYLLSLKLEDGSFRVHEQGEHDVRGLYAALAIASLLQILDDKLVYNCKSFLLSCQSYEGGFGGMPWNEAHGGYTFCAVAALHILFQYEKSKYPHLKQDVYFKDLNVVALERWCIARQMVPGAGGFQGRTNKLVDSCYSYWLGALFPLLSSCHPSEKEDTECESNWEDFDDLKKHSSFNPRALAAYILDVCQDPQGGLFDKPKKFPDFYHTCYSLSGLSIAASWSISKPSPPICMSETNIDALKDESVSSQLLPMPQLDLALCLPEDCVQTMKRFYYQLNE